MKEMLLVIKAILNGLLSMITTIFNLILFPVNQLISNLFPNMSTNIGYFNSFVSNYLGSTLSYFFNLLPPTSRNVLFIWLTFVVSYYTIYYTYLGIIKIFTLIQKLKFW